MSLNKEVYRRLGIRGEERVAAHLRSEGYIILKRNWRDRYGEVDIIAENDENIVFVEVKTRSEDAIVTGLEAIDANKRHHIKNSAIMFTKRLNTNLTPRIDVAEVIVFRKKDGSYAWKLNYIKSAF